MAVNLLQNRRRALIMSMMESNRFKPDAVVSSNSNYAVTASSLSMRISKQTSTSHNYGRCYANLADLTLKSGTKYKFIARISDFSTDALTGFVYIADANQNIKASSEQFKPVSVGDKVQFEFTYDPDTMKTISFYLNRGFNVPIDTYLVYSDIMIMPI